MRVLVLSDIHANLDALNAVLADAGQFHIVWSLGDIVGYGPEPNQCIARLNEYEHLAVVGNHDWAVLGKIEMTEFNPDARRSNLWTREQLTPASRSYLEELPETRVEGDFTLVHGSPRDPVWEYLLNVDEAKLSFSYYDSAVCLVGHTHAPVIFCAAADGSQCTASRAPDRVPIRLDNSRCIINPGAVGQPRDGDPRASYMLLDTELMTFEYRRISYEISETQRKMRAVGLPRSNRMRLALGW